ncbi:hypothetical protein O181_014822 [Austropuccinia psidii MF-1]|uniref:Uncharacterized protein n=1 Tax=Austropuccinia psidii MF-1 TaxID=1389203 RepID=A0A9Q3GQ70_9BASI|nr:hypothetical protein [Austropuccinia psidii MF-1]
MVTLFPRLRGPEAELLTEGGIEPISKLALKQEIDSLSTTLHSAQKCDVARASLSLPGVTVAETAASLLSPATTPPSHNNIGTSIPFHHGLCFFLFVINWSTTH